MQLSVPRYKAISVDRGANLDTVDAPLNNRLWLKQQFADLRQTATKPSGCKGIRAIVNWTDPGPGGFYDDLGTLPGSRTWCAEREPQRIRRFWSRRWSASAAARTCADPGGRMPNRWAIRLSRCTTTVSTGMRNTRSAWSTPETARG